MYNNNNYNYREDNFYKPYPIDNNYPVMEMFKHHVDINNNLLSKQFQLKKNLKIFKSRFYQMKNKYHKTQENAIYYRNRYIHLLNNRPKVNEVIKVNKKINEEINNYEPNIEIRKNINTLKDIINLKNQDTKDDKKLIMLKKIIPIIEKLYNMVGMKEVKETIFHHILYAIENGKNHTDMLHTVITGPPGVGKTELGKIIGEIYKSLGILTKNVFKVVKRSDLIGGYLGQTAIKTQKVIDSCEGGILFIDEAYSLGNSELRDSYSKECIDTINQNLTEKKAKFICIIAGYEDQLNKCFFNYNPGLKRRFNFKYSIEEYNLDQLFEIFKFKCKINNFKLDNIKKIKNLFQNNKKFFQYFGGDVEVLFFYCKIFYATLIFKKETSENTINYNVFEEGYNKLKNLRNDSIKKNSFIHSLYS